MKRHAMEQWIQAHREDQPSDSFAECLMEQLPERSSLPEQAELPNQRDWGALGFGKRPPTPFGV